MEKISVVIPHYSFSEEINLKLKKCTQSLVGADEVLIIVNDKIGFGKAVNIGLKIASGDYICVVNNDVEVIGNIRDLCIPDTVTSPVVNGRVQVFWGCFFVLPRSVYEKVGGFDEDFEVGYFEDDALIVTLQRAGIPMKSVSTVQVKTDGGSTMDSLPERNIIFEKNQKIFNQKYA